MNWWELIKIELNQPRTKFGLFEHNEKSLFVIGGKDQEGQRLRNWESLVLTDEGIVRNEEVKIELIKGRSGFGTVKTNESTVLFIGGNDGKVTNTVEKLDLKTMKISELAPLNSTRDELAVVSDQNGWIYAIGGYGGTGKTWLNTWEMLNIFQSSTSI